MAIGFKKVYSTEGIPVFQKVLENAQGGFTLDMTGLTAGDEIPKGALVIYDESTRKAKFVKTARVNAAVAAQTAVKVDKGHKLKVGESLDGVAINAINTANADYDTLTMAANVTADAGDILATESTTGKTTGLLHDALTAEENATLSVVIRGTAYARRIPPVAAEQLPATIILSNSY